MKISYKISLAVIITAALHIVGLAAYIFDAIPESLHKVYFYNLDRVYIIVLMFLFYIISVNKQVKTVLLTSLLIHSIVTIIINVKYFVSLTQEVRESMWIIAISGSMVTCLIILYYVSSSK